MHRSTTAALTFLFAIGAALPGCTQSPRKTEALRGLEASSADARRRSIGELIEHDKVLPSALVTRFEDLARKDPDELVRATAIRALNRAREKTATDVFVAGLNDESARVRLEAAKALANIPDERAVDRLSKIVNLETEDKDVRIAAADALKHYPKVDAARALIAQLDNREFGVAWQARLSLVRLTGKDLRYDDAAWLAYIASPERRFGG